MESKGYEKMNVWIKDNVIGVSIISFAAMLVFVVATTLTYAEKEGAQTLAIKAATTLAVQNQKDICELTDLVKSHVQAAESASRKTIKMEADVDHIKTDISEIKYMLRRKDATDNNGYFGGSSDPGR